jgi:hypothetical protein
VKLAGEVIASRCDRRRDTRMSLQQLRHVQSLIDAALECFRSVPEQALAIAEIKARLSLFDARRQVFEQLQRVSMIANGRADHCP